MSTLFCLHLLMSTPLCLHLLMSTPFCFHLLMSTPFCLHLLMSTPFCLHLLMSTPLCLHLLMSTPFSLCPLIPFPCHGYRTSLPSFLPSFLCQQCMSTASIAVGCRACHTDRRIGDWTGRRTLGKEEDSSSHYHRRLPVAIKLHVWVEFFRSCSRLCHFCFRPLLPEAKGRAPCCLVQLTVCRLHFRAEAYGNS